MPVLLPLAVVAAGVGGAMISSNAAGKAADKSLALQQSMYNRTQQNLQPYMNLGNDANQTLASLYGFPGAGGMGGGPGGGVAAPGSPEAVQAFMNTPDYNLALTQGMRALDMSAASNHLLNSGGMVRAAQDYGQGLAGQFYGSAVQRLIAMSQIGANAAGTGASTTAAMTPNMSNTVAGGIMGQANPWVSLLNNGPGNLLAAYKYGQPGGGMSPSGYSTTVGGGGFPVADASSLSMPMGLGIPG